MSLEPHPEMAAILEKLRALPVVDLRALPVAEARAHFAAGQRPWLWAPDAMADIRDLIVPGPAGPIPARLFLPSAAPDLPVVIFIHGGGWTFGSIETHGSSMQILAARSGCAVLGIDYRLSPETPFPGPLDDVLATYRFVEAGGLGKACDATRIALAGDSAGANLSFGAIIARRDAGLALPVTAALFYGCFAPMFETPSHARFGDGSYVLSTAMMRWYWKNFLGETGFERAPAAAAPLTTDLAGLPPLYLNAAGLDPLLDDTLMMSAKLAGAGIRHRLDIWPGVVHGFHRMARDLAPARDALAAAGAFLAEHLRR